MSGSGVHQQPGLVPLCVLSAWIQTPQPHLHRFNTLLVVVVGLLLLSLLLKILHNIMNVSKLLVCNIDISCSTSQVQQDNLSRPCEKWFSTDSPTRLCADIDECQQAPCANGRCENTVGSYRCACRHGFRLQNNTCAGKGAEPFTPPTRSGVVYWGV